MLWVDDPLGPGARQISWRARALPPDVGDGVLHLVCGPVNAWWHRAAGTGVPAPGCLWVDTHGGTPEPEPLARGRVLDRPPDRGPLPDLARQQSGVLVGLHLETPGG